jgi:hypothetical protein
VIPEDEVKRIIYHCAVEFMSFLEEEIAWY